MFCGAASASGSKNGIYGCGGNSGNNMKKDQYEGELPLDHVGEEYPDSGEERANANDEEDPDKNNFAIPGDDEILEG